MLAKTSNKDSDDIDAHNNKLPRDTWYNVGPRNGALNDLLNTGKILYDF